MNDLYKIENYDLLGPFLMTLTSSDDLWAYISSKGGMAAGRQNPDNSLFPYYTDNILHKQKSTGPVVRINLIKEDGKHYFWEPFNSIKQFNVVRNLYRSPLGNKIVFEEYNKDLKINYLYQIQSSREYGFIFKSKLNNLSSSKITMSLLNGIQNISPYGISVSTQQSMSNLITAYKYGEILEKSKLGIFSLTTLLSDRPEPLEAMYSNITWACVPFECDTFLTPANKEKTIYGKDLSYFIEFQKELNPKDVIEWSLNADVKKNQKQILDLEDTILNENFSMADIDDSLNDNHLELKNYVLTSDGYQLTNDRSNDYRHTSNVLYNIMRGGVFIDSYKIQVDQFYNFLKNRNKIIYTDFKKLELNLEDEITINELLEISCDLKNENFKRLIYEFLPLVFSRRHGDPSRPWNYFNIKVNNNKNKQLINYEGNWRDIFQNWEALSLSYPAFINSFIIKFLNATTIDGFNPYRINQEGIDWEDIDEDDSWSNIGYWNDHQIIYLLKLLEFSKNVSSPKLNKLMTSRFFSSANVPYRIKPFDEIIKNPKSTIEFDVSLNSKINTLVNNLGQDAKLVHKNNKVFHVSLLEKLFILLIPKITFLIPDGGIWLNTQRPEWNDANNATVGNGLSMVTTYYLRRYVLFLKQLIDESSMKEYVMIEPVEKIIKQISININDFHNEDISKYDLLSRLGNNFTDYCINVYNGEFNEKTISSNDLIENLNCIISLIDKTIDANKTSNNLYHSYNVLDIDEDEVKISNQKLMLEGQVAVLSSHKLNLKDTVNLVKSLFQSSLFRQDQNSFILYPNKVDFSFLSRNLIDKKFSSFIRKNNLEEIIQSDRNMNYRFNSKIKNEFDLKSKMDSLSINKISIRNNILEIYDHTFKHRKYMGRSESMFGYEGINSIYWHMVSKLLLSIQESFFRFSDEYKDSDLLHELGRLYYKVRSGLSWEKTAYEYGAFPFDAYSHTPYHGTPQQPGMTGQVKEDILVRFGEFGCFIEEGQLKFKNHLIRISEFNQSPCSFNYLDLNRNEHHLKINKNELVFTLCQVPIIYRITNSKDSKIIIDYYNQDPRVEKSNLLDLNHTKSILDRKGKIKTLIYEIPSKSIMF
tara:strand:- start:357 stop:3650 length:3294 start_codon:yes stop_codon:yes gene_type:complete